MPFDFIKVSKQTKEGDTLYINKSALKVTANLNAFRFRDKDTRQIVIHIPSLDLTGYGSTEEKTEEIIRFNMDEYFKYLIHLSAKKINVELESLGWKHTPYKNKEYSKSFVDANGELKNFNAVADTVEHLTLAAI